jgi:hypothetical protein
VASFVRPKSGKSTQRGWLNVFTVFMIVIRAHIA